MEMPKKTLPTTLNIPTISTGTIKTPKDNNLLSGFLTNLDKNKEMLVFYSKFDYICGKCSCTRQFANKFSLYSFAKIFAL